MLDIREKERWREREGGVVKRGVQGMVGELHSFEKPKVSFRLRAKERTAETSMLDIQKSDLLMWANLAASPCCTCGVPSGWAGRQWRIMHLL